MAGEAKTEIKKEFNDIGEKITITTTIQLKYEDLEVSKLPESCTSCPIGYMKHNCGREIPLTYDGRPKSCKLKQNIANCITKEHFEFALNNFNL